MDWIMGLLEIISIFGLHSLMERVRRGVFMGGWMNI